MSINIDVGIQIRERRKNADMTQGELARLAGVNTRTIVNYESGKIPTLVKIAKALPPNTPPKPTPDAAACLDALARSGVLDDPSIREIVRLLIQMGSGRGE